MSMGLTPIMRKLMLYVQAHVSEHGFAPSVEEMRAHLRLSSKSGIVRILTSLEERGYIARVKHRARSLEILRFVEEDAARVASSALARVGALPSPANLARVREALEQCKREGAA